MENIKVSVIMPSLNVSKYIRPCIESVIHQTLRDIEIICVDAGSTDGTLEILEEYAGSDPRISVIRSEKKSYGYQMNLGMDAAKGKYMGIVETDDYAELNMFEKLYEAAEADSLDVVKSGYFLYYSDPEEVNEVVPITSHVFSKKIFCPLTDFASPREHAEFFNIKPTIWSAIYRLDFLRESGIRFNETPGAAFQDTSFNFKVFALAGRVRLLEDCFLHYRQTSAGSSVSSPKTMYCVADEYHEIEAFLDSRPELKRLLSGVKCYLKYNTYVWNYNRLNETLRKEFIQFASKELIKERALGNFQKQYYPWYKWKTMHWIANKPLEYHAYRQKEKEGEYGNAEAQPPFEESFADKVRRNWRMLREYAEIYGWRITLQKALRKIGGKLGL